MPYELKTSDTFREKMRKLKSKNNETYGRVAAKMDEIINSENPRHYKPLGNVMSGERRVHIGSFVMTFSVNNIYR